MTEARAKAFIEAVVRLGRSHGYSIAHEDFQGAFKIVPYNETDVAWLRKADLSEVKDA